MDLPLFWFLMLGVLMTVYAVLDGFDLGVGTLHFLARGDHERRLMLNSIGPLWDGNEVWLVTFGGALFAAFPEAYATLLSGLYLPFVFLLFFLIGRAVSIEIRSKRPERAWRAYWDFSFAAASTLTTFCFGLFAGNLLAGIELTPQGEYGGSLADVFGVYPVSVAVFAVITSAMHAGAFTQLKVEGPLLARIRRATWALYAVFATGYVGITAATFALAPHALRNFYELPLAWALVALHLLAILYLPVALAKQRDTHAFAATSVIVAGLCFLFGMAMFPYLAHSSVGGLERGMDIWEASSSESTQGLMQIIAFMGTPLILTYTAIVYWVFRGKVKLGKFSY